MLYLTGPRQAGKTTLARAIASELDMGYLTLDDQALMDHGSRLAIALNLYKNEALTMGQAAKLAGLSIEELMIEAGKAGIPIIDYDDDVPDSDITV